MRKPYSATGVLSSVACLLLAVTSCVPAKAGQAALPVLPEPLRSEPYERTRLSPTVVDDTGCHFAEETAEERSVSRRELSLRGDADFSPEKLTLDVRCWYEEFWKVLHQPSRSDYFVKRAASDDLYVYARELNTRMSAMLTALRVTGDLAVLDEVDRQMQFARAELKDSWRGPARFDGDGVDGYLNWVWNQSTSTQERGRDIHETDEMRTHALIAQVAHAFQANADLPSPNGVDYAERAAFWATYLKEHFEAKWRERNDAQWPDFPFISRPYLHGMTDFIRYNYYMHLITGSEEYAAEARRLTEIVIDNFEQVESPSGTAIVSPRALISLGGAADYMIPTTYVRYVFASAVDMHLDGAPSWDSEELMTMFARTMSEFIIDNGSEDFARDMGGGEERAGIEASPASDWGRIEPGRFSTSSYALLSAWDSSGKISSVSIAIHHRLPPTQRDVYIPVAMMLSSTLN